MVTTSTFYQLNYVQQADLLLAEGTFLQSRTEGNFVIDLYELHDLLVEIFYQQHDEELVSVMAYGTSEKMKRLTTKNLQPRLTIKNNESLQKGSYAA
ncbi:MAG: hypothetical protein EON98_04760 [Chitinophagaceae bacterium]|nr:MAG: hypothetical protein EON98_04760 [Chitinophagaceae bacterium]